MLGAASDIVTVLGSAPPADAELSRLKGYARALCDAGLWVLLIEPGDKKPVDMRSAQQIRQENAAAQDAAREEGRADWDRVKAKAGVYLSTNDPKKLERYLKRYRETYGETTAVNFGIDVGRSHLIVVDCDTAGQVQAFLNDFEVTLPVPPTVKSPGQRDADGTWAHKDGGHFYFTLPPDYDMPQESGSLTAPGGYAVLWANRYVLIPPSVRPEGEYRLVGIDMPASNKLTGMVHNAVHQRVRSREERNTSAEVTDLVNQWATAISWDDLLSPSGWTRTARLDNCGCDIWTAPGDHASPKSATAHDTQCSLGRYTSDNAPLHIWTDNPGPELEAWTATHGKTMSRLQVAAALEYDGNVGAAMKGLRLLPDATGALAFGDEVAQELGADMRNLDQPLILNPELPFEMARTGSGPTSEDSPAEDIPESIEVVGDSDPFVSPANDAGTQTETPEDSDDTPIAGVPIIQPFAFWRDFPAPEFAIQGLLEHRGFTALIGLPGVGKSGIALDMAASLSIGIQWQGRDTLRQRVLYLPGEGLSGAVQRLKAWEDAHNKDVGSELFIGDSIIQVAASSAAWSEMIRKILEFDIGLVIMDTFARAAVGLEENSATDVGKGIARFDQVRKATGAGLMVVHHTSKAGQSGRGSSALNGALDTELLVRFGTWCPATDDVSGRRLEMVVSKQKNAEQPADPIQLMAVNHLDSFVMTGPSGRVDDPLALVASPRARIPEPVIRTAIRLQEYAQRFPTQGLTRAEFAYGVPQDEYTAHRTDAKTAWRMAVNEAIDLALRYHLLQTLTGTATGARYIPDTGTAEAAMNQWSKDAVPEDTMRETSK